MVFYPKKLTHEIFMHVFPNTGVFYAIYPKIDSHQTIQCPIIHIKPTPIQVMLKPIHLPSSLTYLSDHIYRHNTAKNPDSTDEKRQIPQHRDRGRIYEEANRAFTENVAKCPKQYKLRKQPKHGHRHCLIWLVN